MFIIYPRSVTLWQLTFEVSICSIVIIYFTILQNADQNDLVGTSYLKPPTRILTQTARRTWVLSNLTFPVPATVTSFQGYFVRGGRIHFEVWRRLPAVNTTVFLRLVGRKTYVPDSFPDYHQVLKYIHGWIAEMADETLWSLVGIVEAINCEM